MSLKERELKKYKNTALVCLLTAVVFFVVAVYFHIDWLKAICEAAMVGGLADWFAVSALFRKPLGIPFPHSNIIANNKNSIAKSIGVFIKDEFLNKNSLQNSKFIREKINTKDLITDFIEGKIETLSMNKFFIFIENKALPKIFAHIKDNKHEISKILKLENKDFADFLEKAFEMLKNSPYKGEIVDEIVKALLKLLDDYEYYIRNKLTDGILKKTIAFFTDYDDKIINGIREYLQNFIQHSDENRKEIVEKIENYIDNIFKNPQKRKNLNNKIRGALDSKIISKIIEAFAEEFESNKDLPKFICNFIENTLHKFIANKRKLEAIDRWLRAKIINILVDSNQYIASYVEDTIKRWEAREVSNKLELEIGKDLQFIRINGTILGGFLGLIIYGVNILLEKVF